MKKFLKDGNWGLRLLALVLAVITYHAFKTDMSRTSDNNDRSILKHK